MTFASLALIANLLGVSGNQVYMWHQRRGTTGFPEAILCVLQPEHPGDKKRSLRFDLDEVVDWWATYDPNKARGAHWAAKRAEKERHAQPKRRKAVRHG